MTEETRRSTSDRGGRRRVRGGVRQTARDYARGVAGGLLVAVPLLMTMEMWWGGVAMPAGRLLLFLVFNFGVLLILEHYSGFREDETFADEFEDAVVALGLGLLIAGVTLSVFNLVRPGLSLRAVAGRIILESIPVSIGVSVATSQLGRESPRAREKRENTGFWGMQAAALAGAMFFGFNVAPTQEPVLVGLRMKWWHTVVLLTLSLTHTYAIVYAVNFRGGAPMEHGRAWWEALLANSTTTYVVALAVAAYLLWTFGRIDAGTGLPAAVHMTVALGFATSLGAAAANLIL